MILSKAALIGISTINMLIAAWKTWRQIADTPAWREYKRRNKHGRKKYIRSRGNGCG